MSNNVINFQQALARKLRAGKNKIEEDLADLQRQYSELDPDSQALMDMKMSDLERRVLNGEIVEED